MIIERVQTDLPEPVVPAIMTWGIFVMSPPIALPVMSLPTANASLLCELRNSGDESISRSVTVSLLMFEIQMMLTLTC